MRKLQVTEGTFGFQLHNSYSRSNIVNTDGMHLLGGCEKCLTSTSVVKFNE